VFFRPGRLQGGLKEMATDTLCDLDLDIAECLENCPELDAPLLDANFLDQLCLSDELWAKVEVPDVKGLCENDGGLFDIQSTPQVCEALPGVPTPPQSPPDFTPSPASTNESCSPQQQFPNPTGEQLNGLEGRGVEKGSASSLAPPVTRFVQVLKSGEVVYSQLPQQQSGGESKVEPSLMGMATPVKFPPTFTSHEAIKQEPPAMCIGQKRPHPDSGAGIDSVCDMQTCVVIMTVS